MDEHEPPISVPSAQPTPASHPEAPEKSAELSSPSSIHSEKDSPVPEPSAEQYVYVTGFKLAVVLVVVTLVAFLMLLDSSIIATAIPRITSDFHSLPDVGWYGSAYLLASCALQPTTGKLYTHFSSKWTFLSFLAVFELGSLLCGVATSSKMLIVGRAVAGMGTSGLINGALTILSACVPIAKRPIYLGIMMSTAQMGIALGPLVGGAFTQYTTWRWCFYINLPVGGVAAVILLFTKIPSQHVKFKAVEGQNIVLTFLKKMDAIGFCLFAPAAIQALLALQWGGTKYPWGDSRIIGLFCGAAATACVFIAWEHRIGDGAMIPYSIIRLRIVWCSCLVMGCFFGSMLIVSYYLPIYFQAVKGVTPTLSGVYLLPQILTAMVMATVSGFLISRIGYYLPWIIASGVIVPIGNGLLALFTPTTSTGKWIGFQIIIGFGRGCGMQVPIIAIQNSTPAAQMPIGMSTLVFSQTFGGALFLALAETDFASSLIKALPIFAPNADPQTVIEAGALGFRQVVSPANLSGVILAYNQAIAHTMYLAAGCAVATFVFAWGLGWKNIKKAKVIKPEA